MPMSDYNSNSYFVFTSYHTYIFICCRFRMSLQWQVQPSVPGFCFHLACKPAYLCLCSWRFLDSGCGFSGRARLVSWTHSLIHIRFSGIWYCASHEILTFNGLLCGQNLWCISIATVSLLATKWRNKLIRVLCGSHHVHGVQWLSKWTSFYDSISMIHNMWSSTDTPTKLSVSTQHLETTNDCQGSGLRSPKCPISLKVMVLIELYST